MSVSTQYIDNLAHTPANKLQEVDTGDFVIALANKFGDKNVTAFNQYMKDATYLGKKPFLARWLKTPKVHPSDQIYVADIIRRRIFRNQNYAANGVHVRLR